MWDKREHYTQQTSQRAVADITTCRQLTNDLLVYLFMNDFNASNSNVITVLRSNLISLLRLLWSKASSFFIFKFLICLNYLLPHIHSFIVLCSYICRQHNNTTGYVYSISEIKRKHQKTYTSQKRNSKIIQHRTWT